MQHFILKLVKFIKIYNIILILWFEMLNEKKQSVQKT